MAKSKRGLKSLQVFQHRKVSGSSTEQLKQKKQELAIRTELLHKLSVQLQTYDSVEIEVREDALPLFMVVLEDPALTAIYNFRQVGDALFIFRSKEIV